MSALIARNRTSETFPALAPKSEEESSPAPARQTISSTQSVAEVVAAQTATAPDAVAITDGRRVMSYGELDAHANRLANQLVALGVGPETIVGLCLDRSPLSIMGTLAVLKSGGAFLPLDPAYPVERLLFMLNDAQPSVVMTLDSEAKNISRSPWKVLSIDSDRTYENCSPYAHLTTFNFKLIAFILSILVLIDHSTTVE